jgi:hypothetical protein
MLNGDSESTVSRIEVDIPSYAKTWRDIEELERLVKTLETHLQVQSVKTGETKSAPSGNRLTPHGRRKKTVVSHSTDEYPYVE